MKRITTTLDANRQAKTTVINGDKEMTLMQSVAKKGYVLVDSEREATVFEVTYPEEYYGCNAMVIFKNQEGLHTHLVISYEITAEPIEFYMPVEAAVAGTTVMVFVATSDDMRTMWLPILLPIQQTGILIERAFFPTEEEYESILQQVANWADAELQRQANEKARQEAESKREDNEAQRQANETTRILSENERIANELQRKVSEEQRQTSEAERVASEETRQANEAVRIENESKRDGRISVIEETVDDILDGTQSVGVAERIGRITVGASFIPVYVDQGVVTECSNILTAMDIVYATIAEIDALFGIESESGDEEGSGGFTEGGDGTSDSDLYKSILALREELYSVAETLTNKLVEEANARGLATDDLQAQIDLIRNSMELASTDEIKALWA